MKRILFIIFAFLCLLAVSIDVFTTYEFTTHLLESSNARRNGLQKIYQYESFLSQLKDAETGQRGYVISGKLNYLQPYDTALKYFQTKEFQNFAAEEVASPDSQTAQRMQKLQSLMKERLDQLEEVVDKRKNLGFAEAQDAMISNHGKNTMDKIRQIVASIIDERQTKLDSLDKEIEANTKDELEQIVLSNIIAAFLLGSSLIYIYRYIRKLAKKEEELSDVLNKLSDSLAIRQAILNSTNYAIISTDTEGIITSFNPAAEKMLGYTSEEVVNKCTPEIFHEKKEIEERAFALFTQLQKKITPGFEIFVALARNNIPDTNEWTYIRKDGTRFPVQLSVTAIRNEKSDLLGFVGIVNDITERKQMDHMQNELMDLTNFELREPIAIIKGCFDLLSFQENFVSDKTQHILEVGKKNCNRLVNLSTDMIEIQRIKTGKLNFSFKNLDLAHFLPYLLRNNSILAHEYHISLVYTTVPPDCIIEADEDKLIQAMSRLISYAIQHLPKDKTIEIITQKINSKVHIEIKDKDLKISIAEKPFLQTIDHNSLISHVQKRGNDLGLSIAQSIIEKHQGTLNFQIDSKGIFFLIVLPIKNGNDSQI